MSWQILKSKLIICLRADNEKIAYDFRINGEFAGYTLNNMANLHRDEQVYSKEIALLQLTRCKFAFVAFSLKQKLIDDFCLNSKL